MTRRAPSAASISAAAEPMPPAPPASTIWRPRSVSGICRLLRQCRGVAAGDHHQEQRKHFAVADVDLPISGDERSHDHCDGAVQYETAVTGSGGKTPQRACEVIKDARE